jgi:uncharacterized membrane protein
MNCPQCGKGNPEAAKFCNHCGTALPEGPAAPTVLPRTSGLAVASLVLGIVGFWCCGAPAIAGLILGLVAISDINQSAGRLTGRRLATAGVVISAVVLAFYLLGALWAMLASLGHMRAHMHWMQM